MVMPPVVRRSRLGSPVSDDGRGLKQPISVLLADTVLGSPVSDDGRGLKPPSNSMALIFSMGSPVSDDGRGLKLRRQLPPACARGGFARQR